MKGSIAFNGLRRFSPGWKVLVFAGVFLPVFVALGFWQLDRAQQKRLILQGFEALSGQPALPLAGALAIDNPNYHPVVVSGAATRKG